MNCENNEHLILTGSIFQVNLNLKRNDKYVTLSILRICHIWKNINSKYQLQYEMKNLNYLMDHML